MISLEQTAAFARPYPQPALGGALGLTSDEVARAIGITHRHLMRDLTRRDDLKRLRDADFLMAPFRAETGKRGRKPLRYVFGTETAKAIVALSRTETGVAYLRYLIACEQLLDHGIPKLLARLAELEQMVAALSKPKRIPGPGRRHRVVAGFRSITDLFGNVERVAVYRDLALDEMTDDERRAYEAQHLSKISSGASRKAARLINHETKPGKRSQRVALQIAPAATKP